MQIPGLKASMQMPEQSTKSRKEIFFLACLFSLAFSLRLAYTLFLKHRYPFYDYPSDDVLYYQEWGAEIAAGDWLGNKVFFGLPLYPYFWAVLTRLALGHAFLIRLAHLMLGSLNCLLIYFLAKKVFSTRVAAVTALLAATNFMLIYYDWLMMPATLLIFLSLIIILAIVHLDSTSPPREWFLLGILTGLTALGDGKFLIFFVLALFFLFFRYKREPLKKFLKILIGFAAGAILILSAVTVRNRIVGKDWVLISAQTGLSFYVGNNPRAEGIYENPSFLRPDHEGQDEDQRLVAEAALKRNLKPSEVSAFWRRKGFSFIVNSPKQYLGLLGKKAVAFLAENEAGHDIDLLLQKKWKDILDYNPFNIIGPLAILGIVLASRYPATAPINLLILSQLLFTLIFFTTTRHRVAVLPFFIIYEGYLLGWLAEQIRKRDFKKTAAVVASFLLLSFAFPPKALDPRLIDFLKLSQSASLYARHKEFPKAREQYQRALALQPNDLVVLYNLANLYAAEENFSQALQYYTRALKINPSGVNVLFNISYCLERLNDHTSALEGYKKVISLQPNSADAHFRIAGLYRQRGDCINARAHYNEILKIDPRLSEPLRPFLDGCREK